MGGPKKPYVIQQGDYLEKLAHRFGFRASEVWSAPENAALRAKRKPEQLHPGDILQVPVEPEGWLAVQAASTNTYEARVPRTPVRLVFENDGKPCAGEDCVVSGLGAPLEAKTDGDGLLELAVPVNVREVSVRFVKRNVEHVVRIGDLDPIEELAGVTKRLVHLGLMSPHETRDPAALQDALTRFQRRQQLPESGKLDDATKDALVRVHGS